MTSRLSKPGEKSALEQLLFGRGRPLRWILPSIGSFTILALAWPFLMGAVNRAGDDMFHKSLQSMVAESLSNGRNPLGLLPSHFGIPGFQSYQALQALTAGFLQWITGLQAVLIHNWMITLLFAATPWTYRYFLSKIGVPPLAASLAGLLYVGSTSGFGNSFEAYYEVGISSQAMGSVLLPLALGKLVQVCKEGTGMVATAAFFALLIPAHAMFTIYGFLTALLIAAFYGRNKRVVFNLLATGLLIVAMAAWWLAPFLDYRIEHKTPTDIVTRPDRIDWFAGHSGSSLGRALASGRTFDGGRKDKSADEKLDVTFNMTTTKRVRFPYFTLFVALGSIVALARLRHRENRFLLTGLTVGLLLWLGFDDFPFLYHVPFFNQLQAFRVGYFVELFGIAICAIGVTGVFSFLYAFLARNTDHRWPKIAVALLALAAVVFFVADTARIVSPYLNRWKPNTFDKIDGLLLNAGKPDPIKRIVTKISKPPSGQYRAALEHFLEVQSRHRTACNHWQGISATVNLRICGPTYRPERYSNLVRMLGIRYFIIKEKPANALMKLKSHGTSIYRHLGKSGRLHVVEDTKSAIIHNPPGPRVLVVATPAQWYWLITKWLRQFGYKVGRPDVPWLLRADGDALTDETVLNGVDAVLYLDDPMASQDTAALKKIAGKDIPLLLGMPIPGVNARVMKPGDRSWHKLLKLNPRDTAPVSVTQIDDGTDPGELTFQVEAEDNTTVFLSMQAHRNWHATIDGNSTPTFAGGPDLVAAMVSKGKHTLEFRYERSEMEKRTFALSAIVWLFVLVGLLVQRLEKWSLRGGYLT